MCKCQQNQNPGLQCKTYRNFSKESKIPLWCIYLLCWCSILCTSCDLWVHKCSGITDHLTDNRNCVCRKCFNEIVPAAIASFKEVNIGNDSFHVESSFKHLGDLTGQCGGCSDAVFTQIVSSWRAFQELLPILTNHAIQTKLRGNVFNMSVRKVLLYGNKTWLVVTEDVQ